MTDLLPTFLAFFLGAEGPKSLKIRLGCFPGVLGSSCSFLVSSCSFLVLVQGLGFKRGGGFFLFLGPGWFSWCLGSSCSFLVFLIHFFLLVLGLGFRGGFFLFWGSGWCSCGLGFFWFLLVPFLFLFVPFFFLVAWVGFLGFAGFSCHWWSSCVCFFLFLFFLLVFFSSWFFLFLSCFFLFRLFLFWGAWVVFLWFGVFLVPFLFVLLVPFLLVWGAWVVFLGFGGSSCSCLVSSCSFSSCFGGLGGFPGVWGFFLFFSCFFF